MARSQLKNSSSNKVAKQLRHFKQKVVKNKKAYNRKKYGKDRSRNS